MKFTQAGVIGAYVQDIDLTDTVSGEQVQAIRQALARYGVLFFRDQPVSGERLVEFSQQFGPSFIQPALAHKYQELLIIETDAKRPPYLNTFHQDMTGLESPPGEHMLHALVVPEVGGDTIWSCCHAVYEAMSPAMQRFLGEATATHDLLQYYRPIFNRWGNGANRIQEFEERFPPVQHPVVRTHPVSGRKGLFVNPYFTVKIDGLSDAESAQILGYLYTQIERPEYCVRLRWEVGTLAIWDNRSTSHYAVADYYPQRRKMQRATVCGERPR